MKTSEQMTTETLPPPPPPRSASPSPADPYIGSFISLVSKYEIRYEGVLYHLNLQDSTLGLSNVKSYGTEGRKKDGPQIPPSDKVYEYILFRGSDIKDLQVKFPPPAQLQQEMQSDPAIIQSRYSGVPMSSSPSASVDGKRLMGSPQWMDTPAVTSKAFCSAQHAAPQNFPSSASVGIRSLTETPPIQLRPFDHSLATRNVGGSSFPVHAMNKQVPVSSPSGMLNLQQSVDVDSSPVMGLVNPSERTAPVPSRTSGSPYTNLTPLTPPQCSASDMPSSSSMKPPLPSHNVYITANGPPVSFPLSQTNYSTDPQVVGKAVSDSGLLLTPPPSLLAPDHLLKSRELARASVSAVNAGRHVMAASKPISLDVLPRTEPLLPLPVSMQQSRYPTTQFTEEFDFEAMNEKFNKNEVWGYLGRSRQRDKPDCGEGNATEQNLVDNAKPAYQKDDFFDNISRNLVNRGARNSQPRFFNRMNQDSETFGNFQQRPQPGHGGYLVGHSNHRGPYNMGTGYGYHGGRGRGRNMPF